MSIVIASFLVVFLLILFAISVGLKFFEARLLFISHYTVSVASRVFRGETRVVGQLSKIAVHADSRRGVDGYM